MLFLHCRIGWLCGGLALTNSRLDRSTTMVLALFRRTAPWSDAIALFLHYQSIQRRFSALLCYCQIQFLSAHC